MKVPITKFQMTFADVIEAVCKYPGMYTMNGTFGEALALLDGYANGARLGKKGRSSSVFNPYAKWLQLRMGGPTEGDFWRHFVHSFPDEHTALREFSRLWREFETEHPHAATSWRHMPS
jgi:hypothetical protein